MGAEIARVFRDKYNITDTKEGRMMRGVILCGNKGVQAMKNKDNNSNGSGGGVSLGFTSVLTLIFITLKLLGKIDWSWFWVLSPIWISTILVIIIFIILYSPLIIQVFRGKKK